MSPASTEDKIRDLYLEVSAAIDEKLVTDATGRNALYKIHVSLGKIVNNLGEKQGRKSIMPEGRQIITPEEKTVLDADDDNDQTEIGYRKKKQSPIEEQDEEELEEEDDEDGTIIGEGETITSPRKRDSLMEELLSDESDEF